MELGHLLLPVLRMPSQDQILEKTCGAALTQVLSRLVKTPCKA